MNWKNIKKEMPEKDTTFLAFCNGGYRLATRYGDDIHDDTTLEIIKCQYWCELTPPKKIIMNKINIAELLRDCPSGMELDCASYDNVSFDKISDDKKATYPIFCYITDKEGNRSGISFTENGCESKRYGAKCVIFPKGKTTWDGFQRPFKDGDILAYTSSHTTVFIYRNKDNEPKHTTSFYVGYTIGVSYCDFHIYNQGALIALNGDCNVRLATVEEKEKLFKAIKDNGYRWNEETKTLERLPKFKVGDRVKHISAYASGIVVKVTDKGYHIDYPKGEGICYISFTLEKDYELAPNKFDITTLKAFDRVLYRMHHNDTWLAGFYNVCIKNKIFVIGLRAVPCCIPYEGNEHLLGTTNDCDDFYKTWEK